MTLHGFERELVRAVESIAPSVARVAATRSVPEGRRRVASSVEASALVLDEDGLLLTNQHVVDSAREVRVLLADGRAFGARVLGGDPVTDLAVLRVDAHGLPAARRGDSGTLKVGQFVLAVGNALGLPGGPTVSLGLVSALGRPLPGSDFVFEGLIQTDAAINPGNSGGPLVDLSGAAVGINCSVAAFAQGVGFAIPMRAVERIGRELADRGRVVRPWVGVSVTERPDGPGPERATAPGLEVAEVVARSPAHRAGLKRGDVLTRIGPFEVRSVRELLETLARFPVG